MTDSLATDSLATDSLAFGHVVLVAHAPLASALLACAAHVFPEALSFVHALDIPADEPPEASLARVQALHSSNGLERCLVLTDVLGATPCNIAVRWAQTAGWPVLAGVNVPMLLRAIAYRHEVGAAWVQRAVDGGHNGIALPSAAS